MASPAVQPGFQDGGVFGDGPILETRLPAWVVGGVKKIIYTSNTKKAVEAAAARGPVLTGGRRGFAPITSLLRQGGQRSVEDLSAAVQQVEVEASSVPLLRTALWADG